MWDDLRIGARTFVRTPGFSTLAIVTLALGIAANTAMFSVVNGVLLEPLPFPDPDRVVVLQTPSVTRADSSHSAADFVDITRELQSFSALAGYRQDLFVVTGFGEQALQLEGAHVTAAFFDVFGLPAEAGRRFTDIEDAKAGGQRLVLSHAAAARMPGPVVGRTVRVNGAPSLIVGVMPAAFDMPADAGAWLLSPDAVPPSPLGPGPADRELRYFQAVGRVRADRSPVEVAGDLSRVASALNARRRADAEPRELRAAPLRDVLVGDVRPAILILQTGVGIVLLIACVNISSLLIARTTGRSRELAVRAALGARGGRLIRQLLSESLILGVTGGALGLLLGQWAVAALLRVLPANLPRTGGIAIDGTVAVATLLAAVLASVLFGALPALQAARANASSVLRSAGARTTSARSGSRSVLVVLEVALTLVLLVAAGLLGRSLTRLQDVAPGFTANHVTVGNMAIPQTRYADGNAQSGLFRRLLERLEARPEFSAVAIGFPAPLQGDNASGTFEIVGRSDLTGDNRPFAHINAVSPRFFETMGIPILEGRAFTPSDLGPTPVAIVSAATAQRYWPGGDALGRQFRFDEDSEEPPFTIVGISGDVRQLGLKEPAPPLVYFPYTQFPLPFTTVAVKSTLPEATVTNALREVLKGVDAELPAPEAMPLQTVVDRSLAEARFRAFVFAVLACIALALAAVGVYGLVSYSVAQQTREIGIRMALGASPRRVWLTIVVGAMTLAALGVGLGLAGAWVASRALARFLFGVTETDPVIFAGVSLGLLLVAAVASYLPARRALRVDPMTALRSD